MIRDRHACGRRLPWRARKHELDHGREITWTPGVMTAPAWVVEHWPGSATNIVVRSQGIREGRAMDETRTYFTRLRTGVHALLRHVRQRWSIENGWHWPRHARLREDEHH